MSLKNLGKKFGTATKLLAVAGCVAVSSPENIDGVLDTSSKDIGYYVISFKYFMLIEEFGPGLESVRKEVRNATTDEDKPSVWDRVISESLPAYMEWAGLVPPECEDGFEILGAGVDLGGNGLARFYCNESVDSL